MNRIIRDRCSIDAVRGAGPERSRRAHHILRIVLAALLFATGIARADTPGRFDYWVLALSWSPQYCAEAGSRSASEVQCQRPYAFVVHGLWPQYEKGWPQNCGRAEYLDESLIRRMLAIMPSKSLVLHEWRKHGVCSGLAAADYFALTERAYRSIRIPQRYQLPQQVLNTSTPRLEADFIAANPALRGDGLALECGGNYFKELRICLDRQLRPRRCGSDLRDRCGAAVVLRPSRR